MEFHSVDAEGAPSHPRGPLESRSLRDLARMENLQQGRVDDQGLRISHQLGQDCASQGFEESPESTNATMERRRIKTYDPREQVREEAGDLAQEGALGLHTSKLLEEGEGYGLGVRESFEVLVVSAFGVEPVVDVV